MKIGPLEIILTLIIIGVILVVFRGMPSIRRQVQPPPVPYTPRVRRPTAEELEEERIKTGRRNRLRALGSAFLVIGLILLAGAFRMFELILNWYVAAAVIMVAGVVVLVFSSRR